MSVAEKSTTPEVVDLSEVQDDSAFLAGFDVNAFVSEGSAVVTSARDLATKATHATQAVTLMVLTVLSNVRSGKTGHPVWSFAANSMPDTVSATIAALASAAGLSEDETKTVLGTNVRQALNRARESFMAAYVLDTYEKASIKTETEVSTQEAGNYTGALSMLPPAIRSMIPDEISEGPLKPSKFSKEFKRGMAEQYNLSGLTLPEKYGGTPKDGNATGTKDKTPASVETDLVETATQAITGHVGTEGGSSYRSVAIGSLAVLSALAREIIAADEVQDRQEVEALLLRCTYVAEYGAKVLAGKATEKDTTEFHKLEFSPDTDK